MFAAKSSFFLLAASFFAKEISSTRFHMDLSQERQQEVAERRQAMATNVDYSDKSLSKEVPAVTTDPVLFPVPGAVAMTAAGEPVIIPSEPGVIPPHSADSGFDGWLNKDAENKVYEPSGSIWETMQYIVGGTGASISIGGNTRDDIELLRRMRYQDKALMTLLLAAFLGTLLFSATIAYRQAANDSSVVYYADPRFHTNTLDGDDVEGFLAAFNQPPKETQLLVTGFRRVPMFTEEMMDSTQRLGMRQHVAFSFALDLSPWVMRDRMDNQEDPSAGIAQEDIDQLTDFLATDKNDLAYVEMEKEVAWQDWEELATNIKSHIRQCGFEGRVVVRRNATEVVDVHKNKQWANFLHSRTTKVAVFLSFLGLLVYKPYMMWRHVALRVKCNYRVNLKIDQYWALIADKIGPDGFNTGMAATVPAAARASRQHLVQQQRRQRAAALAADEQAQGLESMRW